jgi:hypothetical protein
MATNVTINRRLNLAIPLETEKGKIWVHSVPISREVFESNYLLLAKTLSKIYFNGIGPSMAPRIAALMLRDTAKEMDEEVDVSSALLQEIFRLTNFLMPNTDGKGWATVSFHEVKMKKLIDEQLLSEVENAIIYFIVASAIHLRSELSMAYQGLKGTWNAETTSLNSTEYGNSLQTVTPVESTGEKIQETPKIVVPRVSSIPS